MRNSSFRGLRSSAPGPPRLSDVALWLARAFHLNCSRFKIEYCLENDLEVGRARWARRVGYGAPGGRALPLKRLWGVQFGIQSRDCGEETEQAEAAEEAGDEP